MLAQACSRSDESIDHDDPHGWCHEMEFKYARALLFLFHISHVLLFVRPTCTFNMSIVRLFRTLDTIRQKVLPSLSDVLQATPGVCKDWVNAGRLCSPRVLFLFENCNERIIADARKELSVRSKYRSTKMAMYKKLQHSLEDQIYRILRKSRVITNISANSLFAVPVNQEYVCVDVGGAKMALDQETNLLRYLDGRCSPSGTPILNPANSEPPQSLKSFLMPHISLALSHGFDDNVTRHPTPVHFELPTCQTWFDVANRLYKFFLEEQTEPRTRAHFNSFRSMLEVEQRFSENRCAKVLPIATGTYQEGLPSHYVKSVHETKLAQARRVFQHHARGPATSRFARQLSEECEKYWKAGRQLCEEISLTGQHCINELHRLPEEAAGDADRSLPLMHHSSNVKGLNACNCGRTQANRDDPFNVKAANYDFYQTVESSCCAELQHYDFPVFRASTAHATAATVAKAPPTRKASKGDSRDHTQGSMSLGPSLSQTEDEDEEDVEEEVEDECSPLTEKPKPLEAVDEVVVEQVSTTEYLEGMLHSESPSGLLPRFPHWSLVCLGAANLYNPATGLDQHGFLHGSNYLLPWELQLKVPECKERWPAVGESSIRKDKQKLKKVTKDVEPPSSTAYLGIEYECPRGHRFFCSGPDKMLKIPANSSVRDNANKLLSLDMPLYFPCPCRSSKAFMGQLMRLYIVMPRAPIKVTLNPRVQPAPPPCPVFLPGTAGPISLDSNTFWVMRLPYVYMGESGPYYAPSDPQPITSCRLLKGTFTVEENDD
ncbi:PREDICTED: protein smg8-like isoform X2 [Priapulus caudatus]|nr:PREDICTED: protein smg8-like isoform X2 [Priapulus caudatus]